MIKHYLFLSLLVTSSLFAQTGSCLGELCKGDVVIDSNNYVGVVTGVKDGEILYQRNGYGYNSSTSSGSLSKKVNSTKYPPNTYLIDENNYVGIVKNAFADGRVEYEREGYSYSSVSSSVSPEVIELNGVQRDANVIDENNYVGKTKRVFANKAVQYRKEGYSYDSISTAVIPEITESKGIVKGKKVVDENNYVGVTSKLFRDGRVQYRKDGYSYDSISQSVSPEAPQVKNISAGKKVVDDNNYAGVAKTVFADGRVEYRKDGYNYSSISNALAPEVAELANGTKTGTVVLDENNYVGKVRVVYEDGRTLYRRNGYNYDNVGSKLSYEVDDHKEYSKNVEYASDSLTIGEVIHFFSNGQLELSGDTSSVVCEKLYEEVPEVNGVKTGTQIVMPGLMVSVEKIFANSTAKVQIEGKKRSVHVLTKAELDNKMIRSEWMQALAEKATNPKSVTRSRLAVRVEDHDQLYKLLKKDLDNGKHYMSKDQVKKVRNLINLEIYGF